MSKLIRDMHIMYSTGQFIDELVRNDAYWDLYTGRQRVISYHKETMHIQLRTWDVREGEVQRDCMRTKEHPYFQKDFPVTYTFLKEMETNLNSTLAVANYVYLPKGKSVYAHIDGGKFYEAHDRYHFVVQGMYNMKVEDEEEILVPGHTYWFDNTKMHSVDNISPTDRIALIFDMKKNA